MEDANQLPQSQTQPAKPSEYDTFREGLRQIMSVPKSEIDRREAEWRAAQQQKPKTKKKAA